jgi:predicted CXXCH cytochrome family protein
MRQERAIKIIKRNKERKNVKKTALILGLALTLLFAFAAVAMANTMTLDPTAIKGDGASDYLSPTSPNLGTGYVAGTSRIHSNYQQNTNACAACHAIHTAVGAMLLQWEDDQATCVACHNGSLGDSTYDVFDGTIGAAGTGMQTWGGTFTESAPSGSMHNVGLGVAIGGAPGGDLANSGVATSKWSAEFTCTSCHDPHGTAGNGRILNPKVNGANYVTPVDANSVGIAKKLTVVDAATNTYVARVPVVYGDYAPLADPDVTPGEYAKLLQGHGNDLTVFDGATQLALGTDYTVDNSGDFTKIKFTATPADPKATYTAALRVKMLVTDYLKSTETVKYVKGMNDFCGACHTDYNTSTWNRTQAKVTNAAGTKVNAFDQGMPYYVKGGVSGQSTYNNLNGTYHEAYRHAVGRFSGNAAQIQQGLQFEQITLQDSTGTAYNQFVFVCTTCHVSHGASETVWQNFKTQNVAGVNLKGIKDPGIRFDGPDTANTGSRLKRMPNMATCETCHAKGPGNGGMPY